jgi:hypothetical protein
MCSSGGGTQATPTSTPGIIGATKVPGDPTQAHLYRGTVPNPDTSNRYGGELMTGEMNASEASQARSKTLLGA